MRTQTAGVDTVAACGQLSELVLHLHQIQSAVVVSAAALRRQNCELDDDVANVLQRSVADKIQDQIERLEGTLRLLGRRGSDEGLALTHYGPAHYGLATAP